MNKFSYFSFLMEKYFDGSINADERAVLREMIGEEAGFQKLFVEHATQESNLRSILKKQKETAPVSASRRRTARYHTKKKQFLWAWAAAAAAMLFAAAGFFIVSYSPDGAGKEGIIAQRPQKGIKPPKETASSSSPDVKKPGHYPHIKYGLGHQGGDSGTGPGDPSGEGSRIVGAPGAGSMTGTTIGRGKGRGLLFSRDFSQYSEGTTPTGLSVSRENGASVETVETVRVLHVYPGCTVRAGILAWKDYTAEIECKALPEGEEDFSFHIRTMNGQKYYSFRIRGAEKKALLYRKSGNSEKELRSIQFEAAADTWHTLRASAVGNTLSLHIDGNEVMLYDGVEWLNGYIRIQTGSSCDLLIKRLAVAETNKKK